MRLRILRPLQKTLRAVVCMYLILAASEACSVVPAVRQEAVPSSAPIRDVIAHASYSANVQLAHWTIEDGAATIYDPSQAGIGFVRPEDRTVPPDQLPQNDELHLQSGQLLRLDLVVTTAQASDFLVTTLLDYRQVPFSLDGQYGLLHWIHVEAGQDPYIPLELQVQGVGAHDLMVVGFKNPYSRPWDENARDLPMGCLVYGRRSVVIVGSANDPIREIFPDVFGSTPPSEVDFGIRVMFADIPTSVFDARHVSQRQMRTTTYREAGGEFAYDLWLSNFNLPDDNVNYGLVRFFDFHQIDFRGKDLFVAHFDGRQETTVRDSLKLPSQAGVHELQIVYVFDPYKSVLRNETLAPFVFSSSCMGVAVQ